MCHVSTLTKPPVDLFIAPPSYCHGPSKICHRTILLTLSRPPSPHYLVGPSVALQGYTWLIVRQKRAQEKGRKKNQVYIYWTMLATCTSVFFPDCNDIISCNKTHIERTMSQWKSQYKDFSAYVRWQKAESADRSEKNQSRQSLLSLNIFITAYNDTIIIHFQESVNDIFTWHNHTIKRASNNLVYTVIALTSDLVEQSSILLCASPGLKLNGNVAIFGKQKISF